MKLFLIAFLILTGMLIVRAGEIARLLDEKPEDILIDSVTGALRITKTLMRVKLSSSFQFPIQLTYDSLNKTAGFFGNNWRCPQLESGIFIQGKGADWLSPWDEHIILRENSEGRYFSDSGWEMDVTGGNYAVHKDKWNFEYVNSRLLAISSPSGINLSFEYDQNHPSQLIRNSKNLIKLKYGRERNITEILFEDVRYSFDYTKNPYLSTLEKYGSLQLVSEKTFLVNISGDNSENYKLAYDGKGVLCEFSKGGSREKAPSPIKEEPLNETNPKQCPCCIPFL